MGEINTIITIADSTGKTKQQSAINYFANLDESKHLLSLKLSPNKRCKWGILYNNPHYS